MQMTDLAETGLRVEGEKARVAEADTESDEDSVVVSRSRNEVARERARRRDAIEAEGIDGV